MTPELTSAPPTVLRWLNSIRALGVVLVLIYHFMPEILPGGFIGVDIFFVVSGYLITALLVREIENTGRLRLAVFWLRRWRRLFPAVVAMVFVSLFLALSISPDFRAGVAYQVGAVLTWTTNILEIVTGQSYEAQLLPHLFVHTWTLAVEMQFYFIWAVLAALVALVMRMVAVASNTRLRISLAALSAILAATSMLLMQAWSANVSDPTVAYLATPSHFYPLMIGAFAGCLFGFNPLAPLLPKIGIKAVKLISLAVAILGILVLILFALTFNFEDARVYQWGLLVTSLITALLICICRIWQDFSWFSEPSVPNYIGVRSYGIYLFHWPLVVLTGQWAPALADLSGWDASVLGTAFVLLGFALTFVLAELSYRYVEQPFRARKRAAGAPSSPKHDQLLQSRLYRAIGGGVAVVLLATSIVALATAPAASSIEASLEQGAAQLQQDADGSSSGAEAAQRASARVTLIGDSVVLGAVDEIKARLPGVDIEAKTSLKLADEGMGLLAEKAQRDELGDIVVLAVGTNRVSEADIEAALDILGARQLVFVNAYRGGANYIKATNEAIANVQADHLGSFTVIDWHEYVVSHPNLELAADNCHLTPSSAADYAQLIAKGVEAARIKS